MTFLKTAAKEEKKVPKTRECICCGRRATRREIVDGKTVVICRPCSDGRKTNH